MASTTGPPIIREDLPSSPVGSSDMSSRTVFSPSLRGFFENKHNLLSLKWGFVVGTIMFGHTMYHTRNNVPRALLYGFVSFSIVTPMKYYFYMRQRSLEFFRAIDYTSKTGDTNVIGQTVYSTKIQSREQLFDPNVPYTNEEWGLAQRYKRGVIMYGISGALIGFGISAGYLHYFRFVRYVRPIHQFMFIMGVSGLVSVVFMRYHVKQSIMEVNKFNKDGRLKQEAKYLQSWDNMEGKLEEQQRNVALKERQKEIKTYKI